MTSVLLPIPDDPRLAALVQVGLSAFVGEPFPRSAWLHDFAMVLREFYPSANSDSLTLTARHAAPFPLALGPDVP